MRRGRAGVSGWTGAGLGLEEQERGNLRMEAHGDPLSDRHMPGPEEGLGVSCTHLQRRIRGRLRAGGPGFRPQAPLVTTPLPAGAQEPLGLAPAPPLPDGPPPPPAPPGWPPRAPAPGPGRQSTLILEHPHPGRRGPLGSERAGEGATASETPGVGRRVREPGRRAGSE